jgi:ABC-type transport system substrate-binding protein
MTQIGEAVAGFWEKIGVKVDIKAVEFGTFPRWNAATRKPDRHGVDVPHGRRPVALPRYNSGFLIARVTRISSATPNTPTLCHRSSISSTPKSSRNRMIRSVPPK